MGITVLKFGGSSVADNKKLLNVCNHIIKEYKKNNKVVVVVSAQGKTTDNLILEETTITKNPNKREQDVLLTVGEQITIAKLAIFLNELGYDSISYTGWQIPIKTDDNFGNANIIDIKTNKILNELEKNRIVVVAGFQGINNNGDITTLGRGGSDTTAVAIGCYLNAEKICIYTDVDGVYSDDPNLNPYAKKYDTISYNEMIKMSKSGAKVLHAKCVEMAKKYNVPIIVKSTFVDNNGTVVKN